MNYQNIFLLYYSIYECYVVIHYYFLCIYFINIALLQVFLHLLKIAICQFRLVSLPKRVCSSLQFFDRYREKCVPVESLVE